MQSRTADF